MRSNGKFACLRVLLCARSLCSKMIIFRMRSLTSWERASNMTISRVAVTSTLTWLLKRPRSFTRRMNSFAQWLTQARCKNCTRDVQTKPRQLKLVISRSWTNWIELCSRFRRLNRTSMRSWSTARMRNFKDSIPVSKVTLTLTRSLVWVTAPASRIMRSWDASPTPRVTPISLQLRRTLNHS